MSFTDYPDWQRVSNWDSPLLYSGGGQGTTTYFQSGILNVSKYGYLAGFAYAQVGPCLVTLEWFLDEAATVIAGQRQFVLSEHITNICQFHMAHMGPYVQITFEAISGVDTSPSWQLFSTNRLYPLEFVPVNPYLVEVEGATLGGDATAYYYADSYYSGPIQLWVDPSQSLFLYLQYLNPSGSWVDFYSSDLSGGSNYYPKTLAPAGAWRVQATNASASSQTLYVSALPSLTGST